MRKIICIFTIVLLGYSLSCLAKAAPLDKIVAIVNDKIITQSELTKQMELFYKNLLAEGQRISDRTALQKQVLDHLITQQIQLQFAERTGIHVDETMLSQVINNIAQENHLNMSQFIQKLEEEGIDYELYRQTIRSQLTIQQLQQRDVYNTIQISENELQQFLSAPSGMGAMLYEYHLGHILLPFSENPTPEEIDSLQQQANEVVQQLRAGAHFGDVALKTARGELALKGGDLGWRKLGELPTLFVNVVPGLKAGEYPAPIKSSSGFHIVKLIDKRNTQNADMSVTKYKVRHILVQTNDHVSDKEAQIKLKRMKKQIELGEESFEDIAKANSSDLASSMKGGNLGWVTADVLVPEFRATMDTQPLNEISEPFQTSFGWHIIEVMDKKTVNEGENALKNKAKEMLHQRKFEEKLQAWQNQMRDESFIKIYI